MSTLKKTNMPLIQVDDADDIANFDSREPPTLVRYSIYKDFSLNTKSFKIQLAKIVKRQTQ